MFFNKIYKNIYYIFFLMCGYYVLRIHVIPREYFNLYHMFEYREFNNIFFTSTKYILKYAHINILLYLF